MSAPQRELTLPSLVVAAPSLTERAERRMVESTVQEWLDNAKAAAKGKGRQLASEELGRYQPARPSTAKSRRREKRVAALNHDSTRDVVTGDPKKHVGSVQVDEVPLGGARVKPRWLKRGPRLSDGVKHDVARFRIVEGPALPGDPMPVRYPIITDAERGARAERALREAAYKHGAGNSPDTVLAMRYQESDAEHRSARAVKELDLGTHKSVIRKGMVAAFGNTCAECGTMHRGECA